MNTFSRIILIVLDSVGIGEAPDADFFNDIGANTLGNIAEYIRGLNLPNLEMMGLGNIEEIRGVKKVKHPMAYYGKMKELSKGKDTLTGHWEIMGLHVEEPFQTFPNGFPKDLINNIEKKIKRKVIGNRPESGTEIINRLGEKQIDTGSVILYTSADPVLQIAAHIDTVPLEELYKICEKVRNMTKAPPYKIGRVIARPFQGEKGNFNRVDEKRRDYALSPFDNTTMDELKNKNFDVIALGKITDIFNGKGITDSKATSNNKDGIDKLIKTLCTDFKGLAFLNLVDFDSQYGHRRDPAGYAQALEEFDSKIPDIIKNLKGDDLLIITADHGNDPTFHGTDHTREYVPLLVYHKNSIASETLGIRNTFSDIAATISENFNITDPKQGKSFLEKITKQNLSG